ncbi:hypothetical protein ACQJBY_053130 [Aegilops geniculata]
MELRSGRRLRRSPPPHGAPWSRRGPGGGADLISALPDEMLLLVLVRLRCVRAAVQTSLISRRWRDLWTGLTDLTFRYLEPATIKAVLARLAAASTPVSTLGIHLQTRETAYDANLLLRAAARLSPRELVFTLGSSYMGDLDDRIELPCFNCTTSIKLDTQRFRVRVAAGEFNSLERLSLSGNNIAFSALLHRCHVLRELSITDLDSRQLSLPPTAEFLSLEKLSLSGNIVNLGTILRQCPRLRVLSATFRGVEPCSIEEALHLLEGAVALGLVVTLLGIHIDRGGYNVDANRFASLLRAAARLSPQDVIVTHEIYGHVTVDLPCFHRATSIMMDLHYDISFTVLPTSEFSALEMLSLPGKCRVLDIGTLVTCCPRLRTLKATVAGNIIVHSALLQELDIDRDIDTGCRGIDIVTPVLKQLQLKDRAGGDIGVSILAPAIEKVWWQRWYTGLPLVFGCWWLERMSIETIERSHVDSWEDSCSQMQQLPRFHVLCLQLYSGNHLDAQLNFAQEMEKLPVTNFSVLELNFELYSHGYGALVLHLLRMRRIRATTKRLKVILPSWPKGRRQACLGNCSCDMPKNWSCQSAFYTRLEEVEIHNFGGKDHEHDFLKLIFKCSPKLKRMTVRLACTFKGCTTKLHNIFLAHPSVNCYGDFR